MRIGLTVARVFVSETRDHAYRIDHKQNKTALTTKQGVGDLDDLIRGRAMDEAFAVERWTAIFAVPVLGCSPCSRRTNVQNY